MSAVNAIAQRDAAFVLTDGLLYVDGEIVQTDFAKCVPLKGIKGAIASTGPAGFSYLLAAMLEANCTTFDDVVTKDREWFRSAFEWYVKNKRDGASEYATVVLAGWLEREERPALFAIELSNGGQELEWVKSNSSHINEESIAHDLVELPVLAMPTPPIEDLWAAGWPIGVDRDARDARADLLHMMEIQRQRPASDGKCYIGGNAVLTKITASGVTQRVVHRWSEDRPFKDIRPRPIDWAVWRKKTARKLRKATPAATAFR